MTVIKIEKKEKTCGRNIRLMCDECKCEFIKTYQKVQIEKVYHFCSQKCHYNAQKDGHILQLAFLTKYGVSNNFARQDVVEKIKETTFANYGVTNISQDENIKRKKEETCFKHHGVLYPSQDPIILTKQRQTFFENNGVTNWHDLCVKRGTVFHAYDHEKIRIKALETRITNSSLFTSKAEKEFIERLDILFIDNVHSKRVKMWPIDCYVTSCDVYVQHDGEHWHGLQQKSLKYDKVCEQVKRDRIQD